MFENDNKELKQKGFEMILKSAELNGIDAMLYLIDILKKIDNETITIQSMSEEIDCILYQQEMNRNVNSLSLEDVIRIFGVLKETLLMCKYEFARAELIGYGTTRDIKDAQLLFKDCYGYITESTFYDSLSMFIDDQTDDKIDNYREILDCTDENDCLYCHIVNNVAVLDYKNNEDHERIMKMFKEGGEKGCKYAEFNYILMKLKMNMYVH